MLYRELGKSLGILMCEKGYLFYGFFGGFFCYLNFLGLNGFFLKDRLRLKSYFLGLINKAQGVTLGYFCELECYGLGYTFKRMLDALCFTGGYSHELLYRFLPIIQKLISTKELIVYSMCAITLGNTVKELQVMHKPDVYKGKGIKLKGVVLKLRVGKSK
jgi:ribosomal protein L6P/L9E